MAEAHTENEHEQPGLDPTTERYELEELFPGEAPETLHLLKVGGGLLVVAGLLIALGYTLKFL